ncbi:fibronectin type III domain-containing protein, partial [Glycomyces sp. L485]|uniref:fibronectin type III domain-containing protein n=1 Tax=Glycomyces sp. L485 TaxID=2909235 RepID=UPI001F4A1C9C
DPAHRPSSCQAFAEELQRGMYGGGVGKAQAPATVGDVSNEETVFRPQGPPQSQRAPLDPFAPVSPQVPGSAHTVGSDVASGRTDGGHSSQLGHAVDPRYAAGLDGSAPVSSAPQAGAPPVSAAPLSAPPQAPVSMRPPTTPWMQQQAAGQAPQQPVFAPPVIARDGEKRTPTRIPKAPKPAKPRRPRDERSLKPYVVLGVVITVVLGLVMAGWLWLISPSGSADDLDQAALDGEGAPLNVTIVSWRDGRVTLSWDAPTEDRELEYFVTARRGGDDQSEPLGQSTRDTEFTAGGLRPAEDYCFQVTAVWEVDNVPTSDPVCTDDE